MDSSAPRRRSGERATGQQRKGATKYSCATAWVAMPFSTPSSTESPSQVSYDFFHLQILTFICPLFSVLDLLLKIGFGIDDMNTCATALHIAAVNGDVERVEWLIGHGANSSLATKKQLFPVPCPGEYTARDLCSLSFSKAGQDLANYLQGVEENPKVVYCAPIICRVTMTRIWH